MQFKNEWLHEYAQRKGWVSLLFQELQEYNAVAIQFEFINRNPITGINNINEEEIELNHCITFTNLK